MKYVIPLIVGVSLLSLSAVVLLSDPGWRWRFRAQLPIPTEANSLKVSHPSNDVERIYQFDIDPGVADRVQQFYRRELPKNGWRYRCTTDKPLNTSIQFIEVYDRGTPQNPKEETLEVGIGKQIAGKRVIWLDELLVSPPPYKACTAR